MKTRNPWLASVTAMALLGLGLCLFADGAALKSSHVAGQILAEVTAALRDPGTQWMVFASAGVYLVALVVLRGRQAPGGRMGTRWNASIPGEVWLVGLLVVAALAYALDYAGAVKSTQALTLVGVAVIGQAIRFTIYDFRFTRDEQQGSEAAKRETWFLLGLVALLAGAAVWQAETGRFYQYRSQARWTGPWDNPNTFGVLMGVGAVLALGAAMRGWSRGGRGWRVEDGGSRGKLRTLNSEHRTLNGRKVQRPESKVQSRNGSRFTFYVSVGFYLAAAAIMVVGLVKSYSRGAWVGTGVAMLCIAVQIVKAESRSAFAALWRDKQQKPEIEKLNHPIFLPPSFCQRFFPRIPRVPRFIPLLLITSFAILLFWSLPHLQAAVARRAASVANANDFSWRNRVAAWKGALEMMAESPWFGFGWSQPERVYDQFYRPSRVPEGGAIQLNDYFTLGTTLGIPALFCFVMYVGLSLRRPKSRADLRFTNYDLRAEETRIPRIDTNEPACTPHSALRIPHSLVCRAGAIVLLVGFWFDGGLFKLATASTFWILLELGREDD